MRLALLLIFVATPLLEIALLVKLGTVINFWPTLAIVIGTAIVGTSIMHRQGLQAIMKAQSAMMEGRLPVESVIDGAFLLMAGAFLLTPGLLTDTVGFIFLVPPFRRWLARWGFNKFIKAGGSLHGSTGSASSRKPQPPEAEFDISSGGPQNRRGADFASGPVIEGDYERLDETSPKKRR